jgi:hypothetical protein
LHLQLKILFQPEGKEIILEDATRREAVSIMTPIPINAKKITKVSSTPNRAATRSLRPPLLVPLRPSR